MELLINLLLSIVIAIFAFAYKHARIKNKKTNELNAKLFLDLQNEKNNKIQNTVLQFGIIEQYTEDELNILRSNKEILNVLLKIFIYKTAKATDRFRELSDHIEIDKQIGRVNEQHENLVFFDKLLYEANQKAEEKK